ncbi:DNA topoisomerase IB [Rubrobacter tropicus]|uniref:DNA topoisomerase n=1 Tax=Rubrobacter tropicus TaxID=2653851 RepID=A0A6G8Q871_9ACTN|nr:DNA topoisomerase IB [Rubrobacter tropicus]QIN82685.1 DNA topoisomerase IB [Rubrobacter tropicus]
MARHVLFETGIRRLGSKEDGFFYRYPGTDEVVREERVLARIEELKVPPAWEEARIARSPSAKVQAVGYDSAGRVQYRYHDKYRERKEREKFGRILEFAGRLPEMRRVTSNHLRHKTLDREKVLACMTRMMNAAYFRVGDERYAKNNKTYGIATLRRKHLKIEGDTVIFEYTGKWGQEQRKAVTDARIRRVVEECRDLPGYEVFKYVDEDGDVRDVKSRDLNAYVKEVVGPEFTPKDFRTWAGTLIAANRLAELGEAENHKAAQKNVLAAVDDVAHRLGNTRDIARASYISPRVIDHYLEGSVVAYYGERLEEIIAAEQGGLTEEEKALLDLLNRKLRRELGEAA